MRHIIVVDPSIKSVGGHYFSYANSLRDAVAKSGCRFTVVGNMAIKRKGESAEVIPAFSYEFWDGHRSSVLEFWCRAGRMFSGRFGRVAAKMYYTETAFSVGKGSLRSYVKRPRVWLGLLMRLPLMAGLWLARETSKGGRWGRHAQSYLSDLARRKVINDLASGLKDVIKTYSLQKGDIVFLPTCSENELAAVLDACASSALASKVSWVLLFRRPLYYRHPGVVDRDVRRSLAVSPLAKVFVERAKEIRKLNISFCTDTDRLSEQYEGLTGYRFKSMPIPHTTHPGDAPGDRGPLFRVIYAGDARTEKGYALIPDILGAYLARYGEKGAEFVLQSNYNIPDGEPAVVVARTRLEKEFGGIVTQIGSPLSSDEYLKLLQSGDVNLLLYDEVLYRERSSGILAESLSIGLPCILSTGTWLEEQILDHIRAYHSQLVCSCSVAALVQLHDSPLVIDKSGALTFVGNDLLISHGPLVSCQVKCPVEDSDYIVVDFGVENNPVGLRVELIFEMFDSNSTKIAKHRRIFETGIKNFESIIHVFRWPQGGKWISLKFGILNGELPLNLHGINVRWLRSPHPVAERPLSSACVVVGCVDEVPEALQEVRRFSAEYRQTALEFAKSWHKQHNAQRLINEMLNTYY